MGMKAGLIAIGAMSQLKTMAGSRRLQRMSRAKTNAAPTKPAATVRQAIPTSELLPAIRNNAAKFAYAGGRGTKAASACRTKPAAMLIG